MNLENAVQSVRYLLDNGAGSKSQLSLRDTARLDVATMQYNVFKEWAPTLELKALLEELLECRADLMER
jgi:spore coat protein U-like protein